MITGADYLEPGHESREGFQEAFRRRGIPVDSTLIRNGAFRDAEAFAACRRLLSEDKSVSAILVGSDQMFIGVMRALDHFGLSCPRDISLVTIDDFPLAGVFNPRMTSVRQPVREMAQLSLQLLLRRMMAREKRRGRAPRGRADLDRPRLPARPISPRPIEAGAGGAPTTPAVAIGESKRGRLTATPWSCRPRKRGRE